MDPQDSKRSDLTRTEPQPTKSTRAPTYSMPSAEQVVLMADLNSDVAMDHGSNRLSDMDERKRAIKEAMRQGNYVPPTTIRRSENDLSRQSISPFQAYLRTGFPSSNHPNEQQLAEQEEVSGFRKLDFVN